MYLNQRSKKSKNDLFFSSSFPSLGASSLVTVGLFEPEQVAGRSVTTPAVCWWSSKLWLARPRKFTVLGKNKCVIVSLTLLAPPSGCYVNLNNLYKHRFCPRERSWCQCEICCFWDSTSSNHRPVQTHTLVQDLSHSKFCTFLALKLTRSGGLTFRTPSSSIRDDTNSRRRLFFPSLNL